MQKQCHGKRESALSVVDDLHVPYRFTIVLLKVNDKNIMSYSVDLREKAVSLVEKGKPKAEVAELLADIFP